METFDVESVVHGLTTELSSLNALNAKAPETYLEDILWVPFHVC